MSQKTSNQDGVICHLCGVPLSVRLTRGRKSGKPSVMLICPEDGRHMRAFVTDRGFVSRIIDQLEEQL